MIILGLAAVLEAAVVAHHRAGSAGDGGFAVFPFDRCGGGSRFKRRAVGRLFLCNLAVQVAALGLEGIAALDGLDHDGIVHRDGDLVIRHGRGDVVAVRVSLAVEDQRRAVFKNVADDVGARPIAEVGGHKLKGLVTGRLRAGAGLRRCAALDVELEAAVLLLGVVGRIAANLIYGFAGGLVGLGVALQVAGTIATRNRLAADVERVVLRSSRCNIPLRVAAAVRRVVRQLNVSAGKPCGDRIVAVDKGERAVLILLDRPNDGRIVRRDLVVGGSNLLRNQVPVVVVLVLDRLAVAGVVDNNFVPVLQLVRQNVLVAGLGIGIGVGSGLRLLSAADGALAVLAVGMTLGSDDFGLGRAALGAGEELLARLGAGGFLGDLTFVPSMRAGLGQFGILIDDLGKLGTGRIILRVELALVAVDDAHGDRPVEGVLRIGGDLGGILEVLGEVALDLRAALVAPHHGDDLLTGDEGIRLKGRGGDAVDDLVRLRPCDSVLVPIRLEIGKGRLVINRGLAGNSPQNRCGHRTGQRAVRLEGGRACAVH